MVSKNKLFIVSILVLFIFIAACKPAAQQNNNQNQQQTNLQSSDTNVDCPEIDEARQRVYATYDAAVKAASDAYLEAWRQFKAELDNCLKPLWQGHPCDEEWNNVQQAYEQASGDISNDEFYNNYKQASQKWKDCHAQFDNHLEDWMEQNRQKEKACQENFQSQVNAAQDTYYKTIGDAKKKRDADLAALDELEKKCKEEKKKKEIKTGGGGTGTQEDGDTDETDDEDTDDGDEDSDTEELEQVEPQPNSAACAQSAPTTQPRTGKARDYGARDVITQVMVQAAEEVTGTVIPTSAINDQIFAGIVVAKLHSRIAELEIEESDAQLSGNRAKEIRIRKLLAKYRAAIQIWGAIAEGRPPANIAQQAQQVEEMSNGGCESDSDCGESVCCSASSVGNMHCNTETGYCFNEIVRCPQNQFCAGYPIGCYAKPQEVQAIRYGSNDYITLDQIHKFKGDDKEECDAEEHWHANQGVAKTANGQTAVDPGGCGFGKTKNVPVVKIKKEGNKYILAN